MIEQEKVEFKNSRAYYWAGIKVVNYSPEDILSDVADYFKIPINLVTSRNNRERRYVMPRQIASYLIREKFPMVTTKKVGQIIGGFDHSSVIHNTATVKRDMSTSQLYADTVQEIKEIIESHILSKEKVGE